MKGPAATALRCLRAALLVLLAVGIAVMHTAPPSPVQALPVVSPATAHPMAMPSADPSMLVTHTAALRAPAGGAAAAASTPAPPAAPVPLPCGHPGRLLCLSTPPQAAAGSLPGLLTLLNLTLPAGAASYPRSSRTVTVGAAQECQPPPPDLFALGVLRT